MAGAGGSYFDTKINGYIYQQSENLYASLYPSWVSAINDAHSGAMVLTSDHWLKDYQEGEEETITLVTDGEYVYTDDGKRILCDTDGIPYSAENAHGFSTAGRSTTGGVVSIYFSGTEYLLIDCSAPHKTMVGGTAYEIAGGKCLVGGTAYSIKGGKTLVDGTAYDINI